jgi:hypothetical protein
MRAQAHTVDLPHGLFDEDGVCHRTAVLRPVTGREEMLLAEAEAGAAPRALSELLAGVIDQLGEYDAVDLELAAALTRGDRQFLALHLRAALYGDRIPLIVRCASPACRELSDVDVRISEIAPEGTLPPRPAIECETPDGRAQVREPTGADDDAVGARGGTRGERVAHLWSRLVVLGGQPLTPGDWSGLPAATRHTIALALADGTRAPELVFLARCPSCAAGLEIVLDPFALLARELRLGGDRLLGEIHALAYHYHWPESEILALPRTRRWRYLQLIGRELEGRPLLDAWS